jgi:hypothetical protein
MKLRPRRLGLLVLPTVIPFVAGALCSCGADADPPGPNPVQDKSSPEVGTAESPLSTDLCTLVNALGSTLPSLGGDAIGIDTLRCKPDKVDNLYFNGASKLAGNLTDLSILPYVTGGAYYCAMADADASSVDGTLDSALGRFGVSSQFDVTNRDPANTHVAGRRTGTFWLFGAGAKLAVQDIDITVPAETVGSSWWGGYLGVKASGYTWDFGAHVTFPVGPAPAVMVTLTPAFSARGPTRTDTNDSVRLSPVTSYNTLDPRYFYDAWAACGSSGCAANPFVNATEFQFDHLAACPANVASLTDHILPFANAHGGASCASQNFIYVDTLHNWFQFGRPSGDLADGEPDHTLQNTTDSSNYTFYAGLGVDVKFDVGIVKIDLNTQINLVGRDGFALRQRHERNPDANQGKGVERIWTQLNAQSRADATIKATVAVGGWLPPVTVTIPISLGDTGNIQAVRAPLNVQSDLTELNYTDAEHTALSLYNVKGVSKPNPDSARFACLNAPAAQKAPVAPDEPGAFLKNVATNAVDAIHPCSVTTCEPDGLHQVNYTWNSTQKRLNASSIRSTGCTSCVALDMRLCDASGNQLPAGTIREGGVDVSHCVR